MILLRPIMDDDLESAQKFTRRTVWLIAKIVNLNFQNSQS
jgi:hypothetical protein